MSAVKSQVKLIQLSFYFQFLLAINRNKPFPFTKSSTPHNFLKSNDKT